MHTLTPPVDPSTLPSATDNQVTLVGGPLDGHVVVWPAPTVAKKLATWFGSDAAVRSFPCATGVVKYRRMGTTASLEP